MRVWSLGWEDPLEEDKATHSCILAWRSPPKQKDRRKCMAVMEREAWQATIQGIAKCTIRLKRLNTHSHAWGKGEGYF